MRRQIATSKTSERGFSLIEVMISSVVLVIGIIGLMALQVVAIRGTSQAYHISKALEFGQQQIEVLSNTPVTALADSQGITSGEPTSYVYATLKAGIDTSNADNYGVIDGVAFIRVWSAESIGGSANFKRVRLWVLWEDRSGDTKTVELNTLRAT